MTQINMLQNLVCNALEVVDMKLIRTREDIDDDEAVFHPTYAHQIFGEHENIFGYRNLRIRLYYTAASLHIYFGHTYKQRIEDLDASSGLRADDVPAKIADLITSGCYYTSLDEFAGKLEQDAAFRPPGEKVDELTVSDETFEFYRCEVDTPGFRAFHARLQTFVLWFVDSGCYIDTDDPQWTFVLCFQRYATSDGQTRYAAVGFTSIYMYYAYPANLRPRISQMLVLPPFQRMGLGSRMLSLIYRTFRGDARVRDITVEDPSDEFRRIRNIVDARLCRDLPAFGADRLRAGFTPEMVADARESFKINAIQCRVVYEILRLAATDRTDEEAYRAYRLMVKKRLNQTYHKQRQDVGKLERAGIDPQWITASLPTVQERIEQLRVEYRETEEDYLEVIDKLDD